MENLNGHAEAATPAPAMIHDPPSLPASPLPKRTKGLDTSNSASGAATPTPTALPPAPVPIEPPLVQPTDMTTDPLMAAADPLGMPNLLDVNLPPLTFPSLQVKLLSDKARAPKRGSAHAAGYDLYSAEDTVVPKRGKAMVRTDIAVAVPLGTYGRVAPRSGLASKHSIDVGAGVIDADYRGPVGVILFNFSDGDFSIQHGDRIAQLILEQIVNPEVEVVAELDETVRGAGGFGSSGINDLMVDTMAGTVPGAVPAV